MVSYIGLLPDKNNYGFIFSWNLQHIAEAHVVPYANMDRANEIFPAENEEEEN
ncbi:hypothetical protein T06_10079 [Trichinella sp. T6]|nr:hypothetical protein T06_10079 [Trichinella sp. T6]